MKIKIEIEGDLIEDRQDIINLINCNKNVLTINAAYTVVRKRLKQGENIGEDEENFLEVLKQYLYMEE